MGKLKPVQHDDQLSLVDHLDELRTRLIWSLGALVIAFAVCFWQSSRILDIAAAPLPAAYQALIVLAPTEAFMTTLTVSVYAAIIVASPFITYQLFAYILPAFSQRERRAILPVLITIPALFVAGVVFAYFVVLPAAINFLLSFNSAQFEVQLRAREYYSFFSMTVLAGGIVFQLPVVLLALVRLRIVSVEQLRHNRRYAWLAIAVIAAALPGVDPISMLIEMVPLLILYELSILLARGIGQPKEDPSEELTIQEH
ncbi:MAG: twin-arginine translocase subunit TatC [Solirubrobacterales bacterium]|nr:twin-arginine translocase subunit TatC [Solirubrobacterales bacterium]